MKERPATYPLNDSPTHSLTHSPTHSLTHSLTDSFTDSLTDSLTHSLTQNEGENYKYSTSITDSLGIKERCVSDLVKDE